MPLAGRRRLKMPLIKRTGCLRASNKGPAPFDSNQFTRYVRHLISGADPNPTRPVHPPIGGTFMDAVWNVINAINGVIWAEWVLYTVLAVGLLFTIWSFFGQYRALTHGTAVVRGKYDDKDDPGAINHFQALSAALSATVGLGNIGGVAVAVAVGGPGAVFWMWVVGLVGMALKMTEVTLAMMYRNTNDPDNPHGGPMWVVREGMSKWSPGLKPIGAIIGGIFCITLLISTLTGGNMFQAWSVADATQSNFGVPRVAVGIVLCVVVGAVIIGGIKRIGAVAGRLVPFMCVTYLLAAIVVILVKIADVPDVFALIFKSAFNPEEAQGAFLGGTFGLALAWGMKRALFSSEAGQGSSPIAHSAAKTDEPVREGVVAGLEPFIDTIVVCTLTAVVILVSGAWNRGPEAHFEATPTIVQTTDDDGDVKWTVESDTLPAKDPAALKYATDWNDGDTLFIIVESDADEKQGTNLKQLTGEVETDDQGVQHIKWSPIESEATPVAVDKGIYANYPSASLTSHAFNRVIPGLGTYLVVAAAWLFAISTMISWSYYGEQGIVYLFTDKAVLPYKLLYCLAIVAATLPFVKTDAELDALTALGTGVMLWANIPIMLIFGYQAMGAYHTYMGKLKRGELDSHAAPDIVDVVEGKDVE